MRKSMNFASALKLGVALAAFMPVAAFAQESDDEETVKDDKEIVVTGTLIRGKAPVGSNVVTLDAGRMEEVGATSANQLLASLPQVTNFFNNVPVADLAIAVNQVQVARPRIRNIGNQVSATSPTLVLFNGHRIAGLGVTASSVDPDILPSSAIARTDVLTEGASATYGADAVAGVINMITHRRFDGVKATANYGFADNYQQWSASLTVGKEWSTGSAWLSYAYSQSDALFGRDRDFSRNLVYTAQPYVGADLTCANPNLTVSTLLVTSIGGGVLGNFGDSPYAAPGFVKGTANRCDNSEDATIVPTSKRHGAIFGLNQELGDDTSVDFHVFYGQRKTRALGSAAGTVALNSSNPAAAPLIASGLLGPTCITGLGCTFFGFPFENRALVKFNFSPALGASPLTKDTFLKEGGADVELTHDFSSDWQFKQLVAWSKSESRFDLQEVSQTKLDAAGAANTINPLNIAGSSRAVIDNIVNNYISGQTFDELLQIRGILEGRLFNLGGNEVRLAVGYEYLDEKLKKRQASNLQAGALSTLAFTPYDRNVLSAFGELNIPLVGDGNAMTGIKSLVLSLAARHDKYSDFGSTTNPKIGISYEPFRGLRLRGNWGKSFTAPNAIDQLGGINTVLGIGTSHPFQPTGVTPPSNSFDVVIQGSNTPLKPQRATIWSVGTDIDPTDNIHLSVNYYKINYKDQLGIPTPSADIFTNFPNNNFVSATGVAPSKVIAFLQDPAQNLPSALVASTVADINNRVNNGQVIYSFIDFRTGNFYITKLSGMDFSASIRQETGFGSIDLSAYGNVRLSQKQASSPNAPLTDQLALNASKFTLQTTLGATIGNLRTQATWNHTHGYKITPTNSVPVQNAVGSFNTVNLFFKYNVPSESGIMKDLSFTLNVDNLLDQDPPAFFGTSGASNGYANGFTLGRLVSLGVSKKF